MQHISMHTFPPSCFALHQSIADQTRSSRKLVEDSTIPASCAIHCAWDTRLWCNLLICIWGPCVSLMLQGHVIVSQAQTCCIACLKAFRRCCFVIQCLYLAVCDMTNLSLVCCTGGILYALPLNLTSPAGLEAYRISWHTPIASVGEPYQV